MTLKKRIKLIVIIICFVIVAALSVLSFAKFGTFNFAKTARAMYLISSGDEYVDISSGSNKVIIATPNNPLRVFEEYMAEKGYSILEDEQLGSLITVLKDGEREVVAFSVNKYYSVWRWMD